MKSIPPRLQGPQATAAKDQPQYAPAEVILARDPQYRNPRPEASFIVRPSMTEEEGLRILREMKTRLRIEEGHNTVIMSFEPTPADRQRLINGENIYIALLTFGKPQQPILVACGPEEFAERYELPIRTRALDQPATVAECCGGGCCGHSNAGVISQADGQRPDDLTADDKRRLGLSFEGERKAEPQG